MKKIILLILVVTLFSCDEFKETEYCGNVIDKFIVPGSTKTSSIPHIVFYNHSLRKNIDVAVTWNTYANANIGKDICFSLTNYDLKR